MKYTSTITLLIFALTPVVYAGDNRVYSLYDAHIHYDQDVWQALSPADAVHMLEAQNITRALVSATPTEGAAMLYTADPNRIVPMLRPYKSWRHRYLWFNDPELITYIKYHLEKVPYRGLGEFHVFGKDAGSTQVQKMIEFAREYGLVLHPHTDLEGMLILLKMADDIPVMWAHGGFSVPVATLRDLLDQYPLLYIELSLREGMLDKNQQLTAEWKSFLQKYHARFVIGMDTYKPSRWADLPEITAETRDWLDQLPDEVSADIARNNFDRLFPQ